MFCENCGSNVDGMKFCSCCGVKIKSTILSNKQPITEERRNELHIMGYILAFLPLLGLIAIWIPDNIYNILSPAFTGINIGLWYIDKIILKKYGYTGKWTWWGLIFIPVYLYFRCRKTNEKYTKFICNIIIILTVFILAVFPFNCTQKNYNQNYEWWLNHSSSYDYDAFGNNSDYNATFVNERNEYIKLYAYKNRDGSMQLNFNILITGTGEELQILGTDSYQVEYSITDNKHCWTYKNTNALEDEVMITYIAEDKELGVFSSSELYGLSINQYSHTITGIYKPI